MKPYYEDATVTLYAGDCLDVLATLPDNSVDSVATDPPYGLEFMGKDWDKFTDPAAKFRVGTEADEGFRVTRGSLPDAYRAGRPFQAWCQLWATECLRVLKPGGHMLAFGGTRTSHRLACAIEDAGFEIRDSIAFMYGSGFPKSLNVGNAIKGGIEEPETPESGQWAGWGTALKPAHEPIVVARKPLTGTVAANVTRWGTGALNIDASRIAGDVPQTMQGGRKINGGRYNDSAGGDVRATLSQPNEAGRWPANVILDESQAAALDQMSGETSYNPAGVFGKVRDDYDGEEIYGGGKGIGKAGRDISGYGDRGGASRFFYTAKASTDERITHDGTAHPTVKPLSLMRWLVRLVTPPGGVILEPFAGSGTTVEAAILEGFRCIAIEREPDYLPLITQRINRRRDPIAYITAAGEDLGLFGEGVA